MYTLTVQALWKDQGECEENTSESVICNANLTVSIKLPKPSHTDNPRAKWSTPFQNIGDGGVMRKTKEKKKRAKPSLSTATLITEHYSLLAQIWQVKMLANWETCRIFQAGRNLLMRPFFFFQSRSMTQLNMHWGLFTLHPVAALWTSFWTGIKAQHRFIFTSYRGLTHSARSNLQTGGSVSQSHRFTVCSSWRIGS